MLPLNLISDTQILLSRALLKQVTIVNVRTFVLPSSTRPDLTEHHRVTFDSAEQPRMFSCTCESFVSGRRPCWAAARALDVLTLLAGNNVTVGDGRDSGVIVRAGDAPEAGERGGSGAPALSPTGERWNGRFENRRTPFKVEPEGDADAMIAARVPGKSVERIGGFQI